jgi:hypothetical protein
MHKAAAAGSDRMVDIYAMHADEPNSFFSAIHTGKCSRIHRHLAPPPLPTLLQPPPPPEVATVVAIFHRATQVLMMQPLIHQFTRLAVHARFWNRDVVPMFFLRRGGCGMRLQSSGLSPHSVTSGESQSPPTNHPPSIFFQQLNSTRCSTAPPSTILFPVSTIFKFAILFFIAAPGPNLLSF